MSSEKVLVGEAQRFRSELENTAGDLYGLFSKLGQPPFLFLPLSFLSQFKYLYSFLVSIFRKEGKD
jgi:hypothetical protein